MTTFQLKEINRRLRTLIYNNFEGTYSININEVSQYCFYVSIHSKRFIVTIIRDSQEVFLWDEVIVTSSSLKSVWRLGDKSRIKHLCYDNVYSFNDLP